MRRPALGPHHGAGVLRALSRLVARVFDPDRKDLHCGKRKLKRPMSTVWIYVDTNHEVGDRDHLKVFVNSDAADDWFKANDPEGAAFRYEIKRAQAGDQELITRTLRQAGTIIGNYLEPGHVRNSTATMNRLIARLETQELASALERLERGHGLRVVK